MIAGLVPLVVLSQMFPPAFLSGDAFRSGQLRHGRVRDANVHHHASLARRCADLNIVYPPPDMFVRSFKWEKELEVWLPARDGGWKLFQTYPICATSGRLGPKWREGDGQVPEGVYHIDHFNPASAYHLSLRVSYPNAADRARSKAGNPGGEIRIHGNCVTIGCIPIRDLPIEEVYLLAMEARTAGAEIGVHLMPCRLTAESLQRIILPDTTPPGTIQLWQDLRSVSQAFEENHSPPKVAIRAGRYVVEPAGGK